MYIGHKTIDYFIYTYNRKPIIESVIMEIVKSPNSLIPSDRMLDGINLPLEDLAIEDTSQFELQDFIRYNASQECDEKFMKTCVALIERVNKYLIDPLEVPQGAALPVQELYSAVGKLDPSFRRDADFLAYRLMHLLIVELQVLRLQRHSGGSTIRRSRAAERGRVAFQLEKIVKALEITSISTSEVGVVSEITSAVERSIASIPAGALEHSARIFPPLSLSSEQQGQFDRISDAFLADFSLRRRMLLKRLDVTIETFLWGEKAQGREGEIVAAIKGQRSHLVEEPLIYTLQDVMEAPVSLLIEVRMHILSILYFYLIHTKNTYLGVF